MEPSNYYQSCFVPGCRNTSIKTKEKIFIIVPRDLKRRKLWLQAARRDAKGVSSSSVLFCCEDHFDLPNDMENWVRFNLMGRKTLKIMKKDVIPHRFDCQDDRKRAHAPVPPRAAVLKRRRLEILKQVEEQVKANEDKVLPLVDNTTDGTNTLEIQNIEETAHTPASRSELTADVGVQVKIKPSFRSKYIQVQPSYTSRSTSPIVVHSPFCKPPIILAPPTTNSPSSPFKSLLSIKSSSTASAQNQSHVRTSVPLAKSESVVSTESTTASYEPASSSVSWSSEADSVLRMSLKETSAQRTAQIIKRNPRHYIGVPEDCYFIINLLSKDSGIPVNNILLVLKKIRLNNTFQELADDFGISVSQASKIFSKTVPIMAQHMRTLITWPEPKSIKRNLPIAFRYRYNNVQSILDAFEIEIEKPSNPIKQALSWSEYKHANTLKYLISSTPDGIINYVSPGFSGRTSDTLLVQTCGYLQVLPPGAVVMADRGFKHVDSLLRTRSCSLMRPPTVEAVTKPSKTGVLLTKRIASLRVHIERTIRRVREFKSLKPHSCINNKLISLNDYVVTIAAGLINLQGPLIKR